MAAAFATLIATDVSGTVSVTRRKVKFVVLWIVNVPTMKFVKASRVSVVLVVGVTVIACLDTVALILRLVAVSGYVQKVSVLRTINVNTANFVTLKLVNAYLIVAVPIAKPVRGGWPVKIVETPVTIACSTPPTLPDRVHFAGSIVRKGKRALMVTLVMRLSSYRALRPPVG